MGETSISWTQRTWDPVVGCSVLSPGCTNCHAMRMAARIERMTPGLHYAGTTQASKAGAVWTGKLALAPDHILTEPLRRRKPTTWFVNSVGDLFHEDVPYEWIDRVFAVMALAPQHTFQVLTKRSARMRAYVNDPSVPDTLRCGRTIRDDPAEPAVIWPLPNVWLGVSAEDQRRADERVPDLLATPAAVRFVSAEPLLGPISFEEAWHGDNALDAECWGECAWCDKGFPPLHNCHHGLGDWERGRSGLDWIIVGGESGPGARPMHPDWARDIRDQCEAAGVPFYFKQWGAWVAALDRDQEDPDWRADYSGSLNDRHSDVAWLNFAGGQGFHGERFHVMRRFAKARAGRLLDGVEHNGMPPRSPSHD